MKEYSFKMGKNNKEISFSFSDEKQLCIKISDGEKNIKLNFKDGVFDKRITHDGAVYEKQSFYSTYHSDINVRQEGNSLYITSVPKDVCAGNNLGDIIVTNIFTICEDEDSIIQKTFFTQKITAYDRSFFLARMEVEDGDFSTIVSEALGASFNIDTKSCIAYPGELTIKGEKCYLKVQGGTVAFENGCVDAHLHSLRYNDTLAYYNEQNPLYTVYSFSEEALCKMPENISSKTNDDREVIEIESGKLGFKLSYTENTVAFLSDGQKKPLSAMLLRNIKSGEEIFVDTTTQWEKVSLKTSDDKVKIVLENPCDGKIKDVSLEITGYIYSAESKVEWSTRVVNNSDDFSLLWCTYPRFYLHSDKESDLFVPAHGGTVENGFSKSDSYTGGTYPSGFWYTMPYYAAYGKSGGFYYAIHDKNGSLKELYAASSQNGEVRFSSRFYAENYGKPKNTNNLPGKAVWQAFEGDWYEAAELYHEFTDKECYWCQGKKNTDTPEWMNEVPLWLMDWVPYEPESGEILPTRLRQDSDKAGENDWYENPIKIQKELGVPIAYHVYNWHQIPFNNDYPHFMPARKRFIDGLKELKKYDIRVMPYINALLWDTRDKENEDYMFSKVAKEGTVKKENGTVQLLTYESHEKDGSRVMLAPMCPSYKVWRNFLIKLTGEMFDKLDIDAIYLDQIAARAPHLCMDENHQHPLGGGSWWGKEYNELLKELNKHKPQGKAFTTESNAEVYANSIDGFLSWTWIQTENDVPAFMKLYSDKVNVLGRNTNGYLKNNDLHWKYHLAQALVFGQQPGWINTDFVKNKKRLEFIKKLVRFRYENKEFFKFPQILHPGTVQAPKEHCFFGEVGMYHSGIMNRPYLCTGTLQKDGKKMMIIVNISDEDMTDDITFDAKEYEIKDGKYTLLGCGKVNSLEAGQMNVTVEKESFIALVW